MSFVHVSSWALCAGLGLSLAGCSSNAISTVPEEADSGSVVVDDTGSSTLDTRPEDIFAPVDSAVPPVDSFALDTTVATDTGTIPEDTTAPPDVTAVKDSGSSLDTGTPLKDSGTPIKDAGSVLDTGTPTKDSGTSSSGIACGSETCTLGTQWCCDKGGTDLACVPTGDICLGGDVYSCSQKSHCKGTEVCCYRAFGASCSTTCTGSRLCATDGDCLSGETCKPTGSGFKSCQK